MRSLLVLGLVLAVSGRVSAAGPTDGFEAKWYKTVYNPAAPNDPKFNIRYYVKNGTYGAPIIYGTAGRVKVEDLMASYPFPISQADTFDTSTIVYVEQRHFGSSAGNIVPASVKNFAQLTLKNVVADHVGLIKQLSSDYNTNSFLVFGGGHGGLIAGYVADALKDDKNLKVLGWSSSAPLKYLRRTGSGVTIDANKLKEIGKQFVQQVIAPSDCTLNAAQATAKTRNFFGGLRGLTDASVLSGTRLSPAVALGTGPGGANTDLLKLAIWLRNGLISLGFDNKPYDANGAAISPTRFSQLCSWMAPLPTTDNTPATIDKNLIDGLLKVLTGQDTGPVYWDLTRIPIDTTPNYQWDPNSAAAAYQDYTDYQILYCVDATDTNDPFSGSQPLGTQTCQNENDFKTFVQNDAQTLFTEGTYQPQLTIGDVSNNDFPISLKKHVIQSLDDGSIFTQQNFDPDQVKSDYAFNYRLYGFDQIELDNPRGCDNDRVKQVRYEILRAFGCLGDFVDKSNPDTCNTDKIFNGNADNKAPTAGTCPYDNSKFPWGYPAVTFLGQSTSSSTWSTSSPGTASTSAKPGTSTKGTGAIGPMVSVVSGLLMVSLAHLFKA